MQDKFQNKLLIIFYKNIIYKTHYFFQNFFCNFVQKFKFKIKKNEEDENENSKERQDKIYTLKLDLSFTKIKQQQGDVALLPTTTGRKSPTSGSNLLQIPFSNSLSPESDTMDKSDIFSRRRSNLLDKKKTSKQPSRRNSLFQQIFRRKSYNRLSITKERTNDNQQ